MAEDRRWVYHELKIAETPVSSRPQIRALNVAITVMLIGAAAIIIALLRWVS